MVTRGRMAPFVVTLGMMTSARGLALLLSGGRPVSNLSPAFTRIGSGDFAGVPAPTWILLAVALASHVFLRHMRHRKARVRGRRK